MPTLHEWQYAMRASLVKRESAMIVGSLADGVAADRLDIYRNTIFSGLTGALRLTYPVVERLVGADFFDGAADTFIRAHLPRTAYLGQYGDEFPGFLRGFAPAAALPYLADVAKLEWAVNGALHAVDETPLEIAELATVPAQGQGSVCFRPHPSVHLLRADYPVDDIWRAVLSRDDQSLAALDLSAGPVLLLVERGDDGIEVIRLQEPAWRFLAALCGGQPLGAAVEAARDIDASSALAAHLVAGRFVAFTSDAQETAIPPEVVA